MKDGSPSQTQLIDSGIGRLNRSEAQAQIVGCGPELQVVLAVSVAGVPDPEVIVYRGAEPLIALHCFVKTLRQMEDSGFRGDLIKIQDPIELEARLKQYLEECKRPAVTGTAL